MIEYVTTVLSNRSLPSFFVETARRHGSRPFVIFPEVGCTLSYEQALAFWQAGAVYLAARGVGRGSAVLLLLDNGPELVGAIGALFLLGACPVLLNPTTAQEQAAELAAQAEAVLAISRSSIQGLAHIVPTDFMVLTTAVTSVVPPVLSPDEMAYIIFTSGTTGHMKGTRITQDNVFAELENINRAYLLGPDDRHLCVLPLYHASALFRHLLLPFSLGACTVIQPGFDVISFWDWVGTYRPAYVQTVPTILSLLLERPVPAYATTSIKYFGTASAPCPPDLIRKFEQRFSVLVVEGYGLTETSCSACINPPDPILRRLGSVGQAHDGVTVNIVDEQGRLLGLGQQGEVRISGRLVSPGYLTIHGSSATQIKDGAVLTGDLGHLDEDGFLWIAGRKSEMVYRGGFKIAPQEVEAALVAHTDIESAIVFGVPHQYLGEDLIAYIKPVSDCYFNEEEVRSFLHSRLMRYKVPTRIYAAPECFIGQQLKFSRRSFRDAYLLRQSKVVQGQGRIVSRAVKPRAFLVGETVYLRPLTRADYESPRYLDNVMTRDYTWDMEIGRFPQSDITVRRYWEERALPPCNLAFAVCDLTTDEHVGNMTLVVNWISRVAEVGRFIFKEFQHGGYSVSGLELLMRYAFDDIKLRRLWGGGGNPASIPSFLKLGWTYEGRMRKHSLLGGEYRDIFCVGILAEDYVAIKSGNKLSARQAMYSEALLAKVVEVVAGVFDVSPESVGRDAGPYTIDAWDSLGIILLWSLLEEKFSVRITADDMLSITSVGDIALMIETKQG
ncbi:hypothetical protein DSUL_90103 [Desulfovibrionales bacterium]